MASQGRLFAKYGPFRGLDLVIDTAVTIGRSSDNDVVLSDPSVSQHHARIEFDGELGRFVLYDEGSSNGTQIDGLAVRGRAPLGDVSVIGIAGIGDLIFAGPSSAVGQGGQIGFAGSERATTEVPDRTTVEEGPEFLANALSRIQASGATSPDSTAADIEAPVLPTKFGSETPRAVTSGAGRWVLIVRVDGLENRHALHRGSQTVGRGERADVRIEHRHLSRAHARIEVGDTVAIEDLGSSNRTFVQGREISHRTPLEAGDHLAFGDVRAQLMYERESE